MEIFVNPSAMTSEPHTVKVHAEVQTPLLLSSITASSHMKRSASAAPVSILYLLPRKNSNAMAARASMLRSKTSAGVNVISVMGTNEESQQHD